VFAASPVRPALARNVYGERAAHPDDQAEEGLQQRARGITNRGGRRACASGWWSSDRTAGAVGIRQSRYWGEQDLPAGVMAAGRERELGADTVSAS